MRCPNCQGENVEHASFCSTCGVRLTPDIPPAVAERRPMNVLFCDIVGSTALSERLDPEDVREFVQGFQQMCFEIVAQAHGHIAQFLGDGVLVYFGYPVAREDDAVRAVRAGLEFVRQIADLEADGKPIQVRVGIHSGLVVVGQVGVAGHRTELAMGEAPNVAARVQAEAVPNSVLVTGATERLVRGFFSTESLGERALRGLSQPVRLFRVLGESGARNRLEAATPTGLTPFVGRARELMRLARAWEDVLQSKGRVLAIRGEAGIGKSRLLRAFRAQLGDNVDVLEAGCSEYLRNSAFHPIAAALDQHARVSTALTDQQRLQRLESYLERRKLGSPTATRVLADLLSIPLDSQPLPGLSPPRHRALTMETLLGWLGALGIETPCLFVVEDLQWADASTLELLRNALAQFAKNRLFLLLTFRPDFPEPESFGGAASVIQLGPLQRQEAAQMAAQVAGGRALPSEVTGRLDEWTKGVPLYVEEYTKDLLESGNLEERDGRLELRGALPKSLIPETLAGPLVARIDRLGPAKPLAQLASVLGMDFRYDMLRYVSDLDEDALKEALLKLVNNELVFASGAYPDTVYAFKHALIREAAYNSLLLAHRRERHRRIVEALRGQFPDVTDGRPEVVAYHASQAGLFEMAVGEWHRAAEKALARAANLEALAHIETGLKDIERLPESAERFERELAFELVRGPALMATKGYQSAEAKATYRRAHDLCQKIGSLPRLYPVLWGLWAHHFVAGQLGPARELGEEVLRLARVANDPALLVPAYHALGYTLCYTGDYARSLELARAGLELFEVERELANVRLFQFSSSVALHHFAATCLWMLGLPDQAKLEAERAIALAESLAHPPSLAYAKSALTWGAPFLRGDRESVRVAAEEAVALSREEEFSLWPSLVRVFEGWALAQTLGPEQQLAQMRGNRAAFEGMGGGILSTTMAALIGEASWNAGRPEEALEVLAQAGTRLASTEEHNYEPELYRIRGEVLATLAPGATSDGLDAEGNLRRALEIAHAQGCPALELRAALSLLRLFAHTPRAAEVKRELARVYAGFSEGFDTPDLQAARACLE